ncbi:MAG TPA: Hsp20/alpha crystallin family protein [Planctomycetaceae bacterium]|nr:Hsp20/alpha crystallin family protein [Planctomycetaceae bacterium]
MTTSLIPRRASRALASVFGTDPFRTLQKEMDELMDQFSLRWGGDGRMIEGMSIPAIDISETDSEVRLTVDVPGMKAEEINVDVSGQTVRIRGEHKEEKEEKGRTYHRIERRSGSVYRSVDLPCAVKEDKVSAEYKDGVLTVTLPKSEAAKSHKVEVKAAAK